MHLVKIFWPKMDVGQHQINENVAKVLYSALSEAQRCTHIMGLVPKPFFGSPSTSAIVRYLAQLGEAVWRNPHKITISCRNFVSNNYFSDMHLAIDYL